MRSHSITVAGQQWQIRSDADEAYLARLAKELTSRFSKIKRRGPRQDQEFRAMTMVAIAILDELISTREQSEEVREKAKQFATQLIAKIDELLTQNQP